MPEEVYVVDREVLLPQPIADGFYPVGLMGNYMTNIWSALTVATKGGYYVERSLAEEDPSKKQIIPYTVVVCEDEVFTYQRVGGEEGRLTGLQSVGVGGHINPCDEPSPVLRNVLRELDEELEFTCRHSQPELFGFLNDESTEVSTVHSGLVFVVFVDEPGVKVRETQNLQGSFRPILDVIRDAEQNPDDYEKWTVHILPHLLWFVGEAEPEGGQS
jgi:predicted NUDIX family phosphoesterase